MPRNNQPLVLRLPFGMADRHLRLEQVLAADRSRSWAESWALLPCFALGQKEKSFARRLLERKRNVWLYRCNQRKFCGDFLVVDMSARQPARRPVIVVELKDDAALRLGGGGAGIQFQQARRAVADLAAQTGIIHEGSPIRLACGDGELVLAWIEQRTAA